MAEWPDVQLRFDVGGGRYLQPGMPVRRALIIGVNYSSHQDLSFRLKHCVKDAYNMANFLRDNLGFTYDDVRVMTDDNQTDLPTKENILGAMKTLVDGAQPNDSLFFYFSGHATQIKDLDGDEADGLDECICAMDYIGDDPSPNSDTTGIIVDDIMHDLMVKPLPFRCRLTALFECAHSATLLDLPYLYDSNGVFKPLKHPDALRVLLEKASHADVVSLGACKDNRDAYETPLGGPLRCAFIDCMNAFDNTLTLNQLIRSVRDYMKSHRLRQKPQLSSSHEIDADIPFIV
ncbi:peptidase C14, caspase domain-containing protein [Russula aff. rugulosa BPL654]|nr:peptidase C14, caspase domain-containing protein [Russula aff. rugulosa BPL654]